MLPHSCDQHGGHNDQHSVFEFSELIAPGLYGHGLAVLCEALDLCLFISHTEQVVVVEVVPHVQLVFFGPDAVLACGQVDRGQVQDCFLAGPHVHLPTLVGHLGDTADHHVAGLPYVLATHLVHAHQAIVEGRVTDLVSDYLALRVLVGTETWH